jgi:TonB family protein
MNWLYYLAEANLYLGIFYLAYGLLLNHDTHYQWNRFYLVFSCIISFVLPVLQVGAWRPSEVAEPLQANAYASQSVKTVSIAAPQHEIMIARPAPAAERHFSLQEALWYVYLAGAVILLMRLFIKLYTLWKLTRNAERVKEGKYRLIYLKGTGIAFSFFNCLFIGADAAGADIITRHELVHMRQKHSADILFLELVKIINWFNPLVYLLQNSLKAVHEYIADEQTAAYENDALTYASFLVKSAYGEGGPAVTNSFFNYSLLKKRIIMLNQQRSGNLAKLKYLVALPIFAALLCASTLAFSKTYGWVDIAPAKVNAGSEYPWVNGNYPVKRKRLKVTENGATTITDQFAVKQQNKNMVYTAVTITKADSESLLKNNHIKIEVVKDSSQFTTSDGRLILPVVNVDGYYLMDHFLHNEVHYTSAKGEKGGLVEVGFTLDNDRHITNAEIAKSGGAKLDALALNGFRAYKGIVNDEPGKNLKIGVYFFTDDYSIFKTDSLQKTPGFAGELIIPNYKYTANVTGKGYEYDENGLGFPPANPNGKSFARVIIYEKNGEGTWFYENKCTPADLKLLKDKYGYTFPSATSVVFQNMHQKNITGKQPAYIFDVKSYLDMPYSGDFYNNMVDNIAYPGAAQKALKGGVVVLNFNLDNNGMISDIAIAQSDGKDLDKAAVNALEAYKAPIKGNAGKHSIAVLFCVAEKKYRPAVSDKIQKEGYVGELAVSDIKSPFGR